MYKISVNVEDKVVLYSSKYAQHLWSESNKIFYSLWFDTTEDMTPKEFKTEMLAWLEATKKCDFKLFFDSCQDFIYTISPEEQTWLVQNVYVEWAKMGLQKYAHVVPDEFMANLSVEQLFEEFLLLDLPYKYPIQHFGSLEQAENWLLA